VKFVIRRISDVWQQSADLSPSRSATDRLKLQAFQTACNLQWVFSTSITTNSVLLTCISSRIPKNNNI